MLAYCDHFLLLPKCEQDMVTNMGPIRLGMNKSIAIQIAALLLFSVVAYADDSDWSRCHIKPAPPIGYSSSDAVCEVKDGKGEWKFVKRSSYRCGIKPAPPIGMTADDAACECGSKNCQWIFISK